MSHFYSRYVTRVFVAICLATNLSCHPAGNDETADIDKMIAEGRKDECVAQIKVVFSINENESNKLNGVYCIEYAIISLHREMEVFGSRDDEMNMAGSREYAWKYFNELKYYIEKGATKYPDKYCEDVIDKCIQRQMEISKYHPADNSYQKSEPTSSSSTEDKKKYASILYNQFITSSKRSLETCKNQLNNVFAKMRLKDIIKNVYDNENAHYSKTVRDYVHHIAKKCGKRNDVPTPDQFCQQITGNKKE